MRRQHRQRRRWCLASPSLEQLESRLTPSVGGGWISSIQSGQPGDGLFGQYYNDSTLSGATSFSRWDDQADFSWTDNSANPGGSPDPAFGSVGPNDWSARWTGTLTANFSETYTFHVNSAGNGVRLWVTPVGQTQGNPLINDWTYHGQTTDTATMTLQAGQDYAVELDYSQTSGSVQQIQLQWSSPSTPLEDIGPATEVGLNVDGGDALFANMVNGGTRMTWWPLNQSGQIVPTDSNLWPEADAEIFLGEGDTNTALGGSYLVQFSGMATVTNWPQNVDWVVNGTDLHSNTLQAGEGYDPSTNTTTATMVVPPSLYDGFYLSFTNTSRNPDSALDITGIREPSGIVTVAVPSVEGIDVNQEVTIAGFTGSAANYNGTYVVTSVNSSNNTFTYTGSSWSGPTSPSGGTALVDPENGITNLYVMQPSTPGGSVPLPVGTLFTPAALSMAAQYTTLRLVTVSDTNGNLTSNWADRTLVSDNFWSAYQSDSGTGVDTGVSAHALAGVPWEVQVALANETGKNIYINIPSNVSMSYLTDLADLFAYGSNGITPYTSVQADPVWEPLNPNLKVYIEFSNETWNSGFVQSETFSDGWANQLSQRALYDYLTNNYEDPLYPGGGSNAYNDGAILASYYDVNGSNDGAFLSTYNANPAPSTNGASPAYFSNSASINGYSLGQGWVGLRDVQISEAFKAAFGETNVNAVESDSRVRPVYEWQYGGDWSGGLGFINSVYGSQHPVSYYLYGGGGGWYDSNDSDGFGDVSFANPSFVNGLVGWTASGSAGVVANGSSMGNPNAPPLFSAIAITNGATESGNTVTITTTEPHNFVVGQSVTISGVTVSGYDGTFTVTSITSNAFTYIDSTAGLGNSGDGTVMGTGPGTQAAYLQPGASLSQDVTFSGGYADITLYATQSVATDGYHGLAITLTPTNGGPAINNGQPIIVSEGATLFSGSQDSYTWDQSEAFYTGTSDYTYKVTFTSTLPSGTIFFDTVAIQTVNGMFEETTAALQGTLLNISADIESDVNLALSYSLYDVGYEGGYFFNQNLGNGYQHIGSLGYSSSVPNVGMYANLDPRTENLAIDTLDEFYAAGGTLPIVFESSSNINSWASAAPNYYDWDSPKVQAVDSVEQTSQPATYGLTPGESATSSSWSLAPGNRLDSTYLVPRGAYQLDLTFQSGTNNSAGQNESVEILVDGQLIDTVNVPAQVGGTYTVPLGSLAPGQHSVELINTAPSGSAGLSLGVPGTPIFTVVTAPITPTLASFLNQNGTREGSWVGAYGAQGYDVIGDAASLPSYATVTPSGATTYTAAASTTAAQALQNPVGTGRIAASWYAVTSFTVDVDLTDGLMHNLELYFLDWSNSGRVERVQISNATTGAVLSTETVSSFASGVYLEWAVSGNVAITITSLSGPNAVLNGLFFDPLTTTASFLDQDSTAEGSWIGTYGAQGYDIIDNSASLPGYATVTPSGEMIYAATLSTSDPRALQDAVGTSRIAACWYAATSFTVDVDLTDGLTHNLELYFLDWSNSGRVERVQISNATTGAVLSTETVSSFNSGVYLTWTVSGNVAITITSLSGPSAVLNGLFFNPLTTTASFLDQDSTVEGSWIGTYGAQGYDVIGDAASLPSYATVTPSGATTYTAAASTTAAQALQNPGGTGRIAASWYAASSFTVDVDLTGNLTHDLTLYFLDWSNSGRIEQVQISNATTGAVLSTEAVSSFNSGVYLTWAVSGNIVITITTVSGPSAVLNGLFLNPS
ncbi:MAG: PA14 domain-containing protein [Isosphaeraceae bacterium]